MQVGDKIQWNGVNGIESGVVERIEDIQDDDVTKSIYYTLRNNGKYIIITQYTPL